MGARDKGHKRKIRKMAWENPLPIGYQIHLLVGMLLVAVGWSPLDDRIQAEQEEHVDKEHEHYTDDEDHNHLKGY